MVFVLGVFVIGIGATLFWNNRRATQALEHLRDLNQAATIPLPESQKQAMTQTLATLAVDDITAARMESSAREWVPEFDPTRSAEQPMLPIFRLMATVRQNSLVLTGLEQALLRAPMLSASVEHLTLLDYTLMAPSGVEAAANQVLHEIANQSGARIIQEGANQVMQEVMGALHSKVADQIASALVDPVQLAQLANHFAMNHVVAGPALFEMLANHTDAVKIGIEFTQHMLHVPEVAAATATHGLDALQAASQALMEHGLTLGQASAEVFLQQHGDLVVGQLHQVVAEHAGHSLFGGVPLISGVVLGYQELKILQRGDADLGTVSKNWLTDVLSRYAGGQTGAFLGFVTFGPPGAVAGGIIGGVLGALFGANMKEHEWRAAAKQCERLEGQLAIALNQCADAGIPEVNSAVTTARGAYLRTIGSIPRLETHMPPESMQAIQRMRDDIVGELTTDQRVIATAKRVSNGGWLNRPFVRLKGDETQLIGQLSQRVAKARSALPSYADIQTRPFTSLMRLTTAADVPVERSRQARYQQTLSARLAKAQEGMPRYRRLITGWTQQALKAYGDALTMLNPTIDAQMAAYNEAVKPLYDELKVAVETYNKEAAKIGKKPTKK